MKRARGRIIPIFVPHLGCPNNCVFCNQHNITGEDEEPTAGDVRRIISEALPRTGPGAEVAFYGGSFTAIDRVLQEELLSAVSPFIADGSVDRLRVSTRPDCVDKEALALLWRYGVRTVELGAQSMDDEVLRLSGRGHSAQDVERASKAVKEAGFSLILQMMTGLPGDSREKTVCTGRRIAALHPDGVRIYPTVIVKDTPLEALYRAGKYAPHTPEEAAVWCADLIEIFEGENIPIIRLGLNPTEDLSGGEAVAGAYHPAMGELAWGEYRLRQVEALLPDALPKELTIIVPKGTVSVVTGQKKRNIRLLMERYGFTSVRVKEDESAETMRIVRHMPHE